MPSFRELFSTGLMLLLCPWPAAAQNPRAAVLSAVPSVNQLARNSGYIFTGTVTAVDRAIPADGNTVATMRITFRVEQAIRGVRTGQTLVVHEWAGLWESGQRYRIGERVLLFLYPPSRLGLTSPVGGRMGRFSVDRNGLVALEPAQINALLPGRPIAAPAHGQTRISTRELVRIIRRAGTE